MTSPANHRMVVGLLVELFYENRPTPLGLLWVGGT